jgi:starvation-inducible DNA-binding protein
MKEYNKLSEMASVPKVYKEIIFGLNNVLANEFSLFTKTLNYHWNITGPRFSSLRIFLGEQYNELLLMIDQVAERVRVLDERPVSTLKGMYSNMEIKDGEVKTPSTEMMLENLLMDHSTIQSQLKEIIMESKKIANDPGSEDLLISLLRKHEVMSWKLRSHLIK